QCLKEWEELIRLTEMFPSENDQNRLRDRLCETSLIQQYLDEKLLSKVEITEAAIQDYLKAHRKEFQIPETVLIRQIVLASEKEGRDVMAKVNRNNFEQ